MQLMSVEGSAKNQSTRINNNENCIIRAPRCLEDFLLCMKIVCDSVLEEIEHFS